MKTPRLPLSVPYPKTRRVKTHIRTASPPQRNRNRIPCRQSPDPPSLETAIARHLAHLCAPGYTPATPASRAWNLDLFLAWAEERGATRLDELTPALVARWQRHLSRQRKADGQPLGSNTQCTHLSSLRMFGRRIAGERLLDADPVAELIMPRVGYPLPKAWLSAAQAETVLALPKLDGRRPVPALRDRAILETLYSTGLRRMELTWLTVHDVDFAGDAVPVRQGKGRKDRVIPIGARALALVEKYLADNRPQLARCGDEAGALFVTEQDATLTVSHLSGMVTRHVTKAGFAKAGSCHLFRHTYATFMLEHGANIRHVQEQLGHACLQTTQVYTDVSIRKLKEVHAAMHPGAKLAPQGEPKNNRNDTLADNAGERQCVGMSEIIFEVSEDEMDGGYTASALGHGIATQGDTIDELREMVRAAVQCHFGDGVPGEMPKVIRLHFVRDEVLAV